MRNDLFHRGGLAASLALAVLAAGPCSATPSTDRAAWHDPALQREQQHRATVARLYDDMLDTTPLPALGQYFSADLVQHDPAVADGRPAMLDAIAELRARHRHGALQVKHLLADRDLVLAHLQLSDTPDDPFSGQDRFELFRFDGPRIAEHWLVAADVLPWSASGHSAFSDLLPAQHPDEATEEANRLITERVSERVFGGHRFDLLEDFWAADYRQHNPYVGDGRDALSAVLGYIAPPGSHYRVTLSLADGDLAAVCAQASDPGQDADDPFLGTAVCDLYRVDDLRLVEHWDVFQPIPASSASGHPMFAPATATAR